MRNRGFKTRLRQRLPGLDLGELRTALEVIGDNAVIKLPLSLLSGGEIGEALKLSKTEVSSTRGL